MRVLGRDLRGNLVALLPELRILAADVLDRHFSQQQLRQARNAAPTHGRRSVAPSESYAHSEEQIRGSVSVQKALVTSLPDI